jgi:hypothetical protein
MHGSGSELMLRGRSPYDLGVTDGRHDAIWDAFVTAMLAAGATDERRSRYGDKPAVFVDRREVAHLEGPGIIDLRITRAGWSRAKPDFSREPAVQRDPSRRDWIELRLRSLGELDHVAGLLALAVASNR